MVRSCFRLGFQNVMSKGTLDQSCIEWAEQLGIHPLKLFHEINNYLGDIQKTKIDDFDVTHFYNFLDLMLEKYGFEYKKALERIGLNDSVSSDFLSKMK